MRIITVVLEVIGLLCIVGGAALIFWPAAVILAGVALLWVSWGLNREVKR